MANDTYTHHKRLYKQEDYNTANSATNRMVRDTNAPQKKPKYLK